MKRSLLLFIILIISGFALAHEFWLSPQRFFYSVRETARIRFYVGENFTGENWGGNHDKIQELVHYSPGGVFDLSRSITANKGDSISLPLQEAGTHMIAFHSTNSFIKLEADKFNAYLKEDGLAAVAAYRKAHNEESLEGREYYQRSVKTIIQVGDKITDECLQPTGLPLDIIPATNPYELPDKISRNGLMKVKFRVLFHQQPLADALVKVWYSIPGKPVKMEEMHTSKTGWITAERHPGRFLVSCVHMEKSTVDSSADWQSYWGSLSFEYSQFFPEEKTARGR